MDIEINEVQEIIKNLDGSGELSIKEEKYLKVAKLCVQLAAENVALKAAFHPSDIPSEWTDVFGDTAVIEHDAAGDNQGHSISWSWVDNQEEVIKSVLIAVDKGIETPDTDRIVAGIKADGVEEFSKTLEGAADICGKSKAWEAQENLLDFAERGFAFAKQLRDGGNGE